MARLNVYFALHSHYMCKTTMKFSHNLSCNDKAVAGSCEELSNDGALQKYDEDECDY